MKILGIFLGFALIMSVGLTFFVFPAKEKAPEPFRQQYAQVFAEFGQNAEEVYRQNNTDGLELLQNHRLEGLRVLKQSGQSIAALQPYLDGENLFAICLEQGAQLEALLRQFQPAAIAEVQKRFGSDGLRYMLDDPEVYFLLLKYGERLVQLANTKGTLVFALVKRQPPEFIELYYDDGLFKAISRFGADGLLAVKTYRGMATAIFDMFADDERFAATLRQYGYQQVIPVLDYFYQKQADSPVLQNALDKLALSGLFQPTPAEATTSSGAAKPPAATDQQRQFDRAHWALDQIAATGQTFLRQFEIGENGTVRPVQLLSMTNLLEDVLIGGWSGQTPPARVSGSGETGFACEQLRTALDLLGLLPSETVIAKQARCLYLRTGLAAATTVAGLTGLHTLDQQTDLAARYGDAIIPFVAQYGKEGIQLLQQTDGQILRFAAKYGADFIHLVSKYGPDVLDLVEQFGDPLVAVMRKTNGAVIPYVQKYRAETAKVLAQPEGKDLVALAAVFGAEILPYAAREPDDFRRYLLKYGDVAVNALREHEKLAVAAAQKYGDDMIRYLGLYGQEAARLIGAGRLGITLLRVMPDDIDAQAGQQLLQTGFGEAAWNIFTSHPRQFNTYLGLLGAETFPLAPYWLQLLFWTLAGLVGLYALRLAVKISKLVFSW